MLKITVTGIDQAISKLDRMNKDFPAMLEKSMLQTVLYVQGQLPGYPPPPPASKYRRTGTLGRTITSLAGQNPDALSRVDPIFGGVQGIIGTQLSYAPYVIDEDQQAAVHRGRWWTLQAEVRKQTDKIVEFMRNKVTEFVNKYL